LFFLENVFRKKWFFVLRRKYIGDGKVR